MWKMQCWRCAQDADRMMDIFPTYQCFHFEAIPSKVARMQFWLPGIFANVTRE